MENVVAFNNELSGLYDSKPPISKAKMAAITKSAMRAIKFYKHVVQSVEKFILKCKPEYKVPGLYVIDSIVRQSRHQFGPEKDVFAPRFARNIKDTFANLFRCAPEDKSRIIRVLNLWQKNSVFAPEVIQPIFDLADPNHPIYQMPPGGIMGASSAGGPSGSGGNMAEMTSSSSNGLNASATSMDMSMVGAAGMVGANTMSGIGASGDDKLGAGVPDLSSKSHDKGHCALENSTLRQLEHMQHYLKRQTAPSASTSSATAAGMVASYGCLIDDDGVAGVSFGASGGGCSKVHHSESFAKYTKSSHEVFYDDDDDDDVNAVGDNSPPNASSALLNNNNLKQLLNDPNVLRQLQTLQSFQKFKQQEDKQYKQNELRMQEEAFEKHLHNVLKGSGSSTAQDGTDFNKEVEFVSEVQAIEVINLDGNDSRSPTPERDRYKRRRSRSPSRSRDRGGGGGGGISGRDRDRDRRRRSRTRTRSRSPRSSNRRRSSRDRDRNNRDKEKDREHERERRKKGLPELKKEHLSVCSTTLWVGHLSKLVYQEELSDTFAEYGDIVSIDQIVPRGCAFIVMHRRQDAHKAMQGLKNHKLQGRAIMISWAAGKGVKSKEWKDYWDLDLGVTYIPWNKLDEHTDLDILEEGGMFDEDSMPGWMKDKMNHLKGLKEPKGNDAMAMSSAAVAAAAAAASSAGPSGMIFGIDTTQPPPGPPPTGGPPPAMMSMVPGQFQMAPPMSGPPRMLGPMGPMQLSGIPMPANLVPGMPPPPHTMIMPPGMMPAGFPPMPSQSQVGAHLSLSTGATQFPPPGAAPALGPPPGSALNMGGGGHGSSDDQMDIEMDEDDAPVAAAAQVNFNQPPPPMFGTGSSSVAGGASDGGGDLFGRERNRSSAGTSRWGSRGAGDDDASDGPSRWRENGVPSAPPNFADARGGPRALGGTINIPPLDLNNPPQRPDFMNDFENSGGSRGGSGASGARGDFFSNNMPPNRFNQPTSLLQMRIPPPNSFNPRMSGGSGSGPPMFMRGQGGPGGGGRQQGPGFFNQRNPFERDISRSGSGGGGGGGGAGTGGGGRGNSTGGGGGRGVGRGGRGSNNSNSAAGGSGNWSDEENGDDGGNNFKRRGGNRFRDRDGSDDWNSRDRGGRRGMGGGGGGAADRNAPTSRDRHDRDFDRERERAGGVGGRPAAAGRRDSRDDASSRVVAEPLVPPAPPAPTGDNGDTEDDWDRELEEYDAREAARQNAEKAGTAARPATTTTTFREALSSSNSNGGFSRHQDEEEDNAVSEKADSVTAHDRVSASVERDNKYQDVFVKPPLTDENMANSALQAQSVGEETPRSVTMTATVTTTPLYDELPAPAAAVVPVDDATDESESHAPVSALSSGPSPQTAATTQDDEASAAPPISYESVAVADANGGSPTAVNEAAPVAVNE